MEDAWLRSNICHQKVCLIISFMPIVEVQEAGSLSLSFTWSAVVEEHWVAAAVTISFTAR